MAVYSVVHDFTDMMAGLDREHPIDAEPHDMLREMRAALAEDGSYELHGDELRRVIALLERDAA